MAHKRSQIVATVRNTASNTKRPEPGGALVSVIGFASPLGGFPIRFSRPEGQRLSVYNRTPPCRR